MRFTTILSVAAFAGAALAQNGQPGDGCAAGNVLTACLSTQGARIAQCKTLDYGCMCEVQSYVLQCYDQCPNDVNRSTEQSKLTAYCVAASATVSVAAPTSASTFVVQTSGSTASPTSSDDDATPTDSADGTSTETESATGTKSSSGKAATSEPAGSSAAKITWMCASSLMAVLTAAFMAL
ncbi:hypothetical protein TWF481_004727 [Arthrobotrys musiformis]|uniref:Extracellular membrane protein CFEM domain-containing protein n=1 Tax=Arthrobotrys musiformis TaxID=47236 RepID=A0AAV9WLK4_9PEZI